MITSGRAQARRVVRVRRRAPVKTYVSRLLTKLDRRDRVQLAVLAYESGLLQIGEG